MDHHDVIAKMREKNVVFGEGLTESEALEVEELYNFCFPPDVKCFLQTALPVGKNRPDGVSRFTFPNWREALKPEHIPAYRKWLDSPLEGMLFDVEFNNLWLELWGEAPAAMEDKKLIATRHYYTYPKLIPVYGHRFIPSRPCEEGNPVFSVHQMDIVYYGNDLVDYFMTEFGFQGWHSTHPLKQIEFWSWWTENWYTEGLR